MSELFSIQLQNRQQQGRDGVWLDLPTTTEQVQAALRQIGISSDNPQGLFISGYFAEEEKRFAISYNMVLASNVDELNFLASRLETLSTGERAELNAALQAPQSELFSIGRITDFPENVDYYVHLPDVHGPAQLGDYYLNRSGMVNMPEEWKGGIDTAQFGRYVAQQEQGAFTQYGYLVKSGDEWQKVHEGQPVPEEYRVLSFPVPEVMRDAANIPPPESPPQQQRSDIPPESSSPYRAKTAHLFLIPHDSIWNISRSHYRSAGSGVASNADLPQADPVENLQIKQLCDILSSESSFLCNKTNLFSCNQNPAGKTTRVFDLIIIVISATIMAQKRHDRPTMHNGCHRNFPVTSTIPAHIALRIVS